MGSEDETKSVIPNNTELIDFLYVDKEKLDSFLSQIQQGTLRSVEKSNGASESSSISGKAGVPGLLNATCNNKNKNDSISKENYDPYHSQILDLLNYLQLPVISSVPDSCTSRLCLMQGIVKIRDIASVKRIFPIFLKSPDIFPIKDKSTRALLKTMGEMIENLPDAIDCSISLDSNTISGSLHENSLSISQADLLRTYGLELPGDWYVLGIVDEICNSNYNTPSLGTIDDVIDALSSALSSMYSNSKYKMVPILIFRKTC